MSNIFRVECTFALTKSFTVFATAVLRGTRAVANMQQLGSNGGTPKNMTCDWLMRISLVIFVVLSLVRISILSKPLLRPGWCQVLEYKCSETNVHFICTTV